MAVAKKNPALGSLLRSLRWAFFFVAIGVGPTALGAEVAEPLIKTIQITGNHKIESAAISARLKSKTGQRRSLETVQDDLRSIFGMGYFERVEAQEDDEPGGVKLIFQVVERPVIVKIDYVGLEALDKDDIKDQIEIRLYEFLDYAKLNRSVEKLQAKYEEKGFFLADVRYDVAVDPKRNEAVVTFKIQENDKVQVHTINIIGNKMVSADELKRVMQTKEGDLLSFLTGSGSYREAVFERDLAALGYYYGTLGYVRARFSKPEVSVTADKKFIFITFAVDEGLQYNVGKVDFSGDLLYTREELMSDMGLIPGEVFNTDILRRETLKYTEKYGDLGYAFANVVPQPTIHDDTRTVDVTFEVDRGERVFIGKISITGNTRTKDKVVRRELRIMEGELYNGTRKRLSRENVVRLGFFENVDFQQSTSKTAANVVDIEIKVKERSTGQLVIGAGYASGNIGFTAQAQLAQNNFLGNGQVASFTANVMTGQSFYDLNLSFTEPYWGTSTWSVGATLYNQRRNLFVIPNIPTYTEIKTGFDFRLGHPIVQFTNMYLTYKLENSNVPTESIIDTALIPPSLVNGVTSSVAANMVYDKRDDRFDPRNGFYWSASSEAAGIGGTRKFLKSRGNMKFFHPIVWDFVFRWNLVASNISELGAPVPINELFIQGGLFSQRGYNFLSIGPQETLSATQSPTLSAAAQAANVGGQQIVIGGHNELLMQAEVEFPLLKEARIRGVFFIDTGNAYDGVLWQNSPILYSNFGYGFRWFTPIGPLRFEFGYPMFPGGAPKFYFTIGPPF